MFFAGEDATLACLLRDSLRAEKKSSVVACVVTDPMVENPGVRVFADTFEAVHVAVGEAEQWLLDLRAALLLSHQNSVTQQKC